MQFLHTQDYRRVVTDDVLQIVARNDDNIRVEAELAAQQEMESYLAPRRYDIDVIFSPCLPYDGSRSYDAGACVTFEIPPYSPATTYTINRLVKADIGSGMHHFKSLQLSTGTPLEDTDYWEDLGRFFGIYTAIEEIPVGLAPDRTSTWEQRDSRNPLVVMYMVDIALYHVHSRLNPRNIPELRVNRYDSAITWLNRLAKGQVSSPGLPQLEDDQGTTSVNIFRSGGTTSRVNHSI